MEVVPPPAEKKRASPQSKEVQLPPKKRNRPDSPPLEGEIELPSNYSIGGLLGLTESVVDAEVISFAPVTTQMCDNDGQLFGPSDYEMKMMELQGEISLIDSP